MPRSTPFYEGTTAIQSQDLFFRKIVKDQVAPFWHPSAQVDQWIAAAVEWSAQRGSALLQQALDDVGAIVTTMINDLGASIPRAPCANS